MFSPKLYEVLKFPMKFIAERDFNVQLTDDERIAYSVKQGDNMLFRQIRMISCDSSPRQKFAIFVDCSGGQNKRDAMKHLVEKGFKVDGRKFVMSERSASMVRTGILSFVESHVEPELKKRILMGTEIEKTVLSKHLAYRGLFLSSCHCLEGWRPKIVIVPDCKTVVPQQRIKYVYDKQSKFIDRKTGLERDWVQKDIAETVQDITINAFDGCGICHPTLMREVEHLIGTSERINSFIIRGPYLKGMIHEMDYETFFAERGVLKIKDVWGEEYDVSPGAEPLMIMTESEYKGIKYFKRDGTINDWKNYWDMFDKYHHCLGVAKWNFTSDQEPLRTRVNYQVLQDLALDYTDFRELANDSTAWYEKIINGDEFYTRCFLGLMADSHEVLNHYMAAVMRNPAMMKEPTVRGYIKSLLEKYKDQFKCGKLWMNATFKFLAPDMIALMEHIGGLEVRGCIGPDEFYSFDRRGIMEGERLIERNPHICRSEHTTLRGINTELLEKYCSHLVNVAVIGINNIVPQKLNGADYDGDLVCVIDEPLMMKGVDRNAATVIDIEDKVTALEEPYDLKHIFECTMRGLKSQIGEISNYSTTYHNRVPKTEETKKLYDSFIDLLSVANGKEIDFAKTGVKYPVPRNIQKYGRPLPYFMKYVGPTYARMRNLSRARSNMNQLCMDLEYWEYRVKYPRNTGTFDWSIMFDEEIGYNEDVFKEIERLFLDFNEDRKERLKFEHMCHNWNLFHKDLEGRISKKEAQNYETNWQAIYNVYRNKCKLYCPDVRELANILVVLCYEKYPNKYKKFMWHMAGAGIVENIKPVPVSLPQRDPNGEYEYLGQRYSMAEEKVYEMSVA